MPELPEVEVTARGLNRHLPGRQIRAVGLLDWPRMLANRTPEELASVLPGQTILAARRRGKYIELKLDTGGCLLFHRKMTGNLLVTPAGTPGGRHAHFSISTSGERELRFVDPRKFGRVYYFASLEEEEDFLRARIGLDPLAELTEQSLQSLLSRRKGRLKSLLLDQRLIAGIGNLYADEMLWEAGLAAERSASSLSPKEADRLYAAMQAVLSRAIERRGTSLSDHLDADGLPGSNQDHLNVYGRAGQPCPRCGVTILRRVVAQRGTWYCPGCQR